MSRRPDARQSAQGVRDAERQRQRDGHQTPTPQDHPVDEHLRESKPRTSTPKASLELSLNGPPSRSRPVGSDTRSTIACAGSKRAPDSTHRSATPTSPPTGIAHVDETAPGTRCPGHTPRTHGGDAR